MKTHKTLLLTALLLGCLTFRGVAQKQIASNDLSAFVGTWEYKTATEYFKVVLQNGTMDTQLIYPCLVGGYYYEKNGVVIADYLSPIPLVINNSNSKQIKIVAGSLALIGAPVAKTAIGLSFMDDKKGQKGSGMESKLVLLSQNRMQWVLTEAEQILLTDGDGNYYEGYEPEPLGFSVPTDVVLTKVVQRPPLPPFNPDRPDDPYDLIP